MMYLETTGTGKSTALQGDFEGRKLWVDTIEPALWGATELIHFGLRMVNTSNDTSHFSIEINGTVKFERKVSMQVDSESIILEWAMLNRGTARDPDYGRCIFLCLPLLTYMFSKAHVAIS